MDGSDDVYAFVIAKQTFDLGPNGTLATAAEGLPISAEPIATPFGTFHGEIYPRKDRVDFVVLGTVRLPALRDQTVVTARVGGFANRLRIIGDRTWTSAGRGAPMPSTPQRFLEMPIAYSRAFGGKSLGRLGEVAWPNNPDGIGFYQTADEAMGKPLPNIEWADARGIRSWEERPDPAGWGPYPMFWGLRAVQSVVRNGQNQVAGISRKAFNHAHPAMVVDSIAEDDLVSVEGVVPQPVRFAVPRMPLSLRWQSGQDQGEVALSIDGLYVWIDQCKVIVTRRARFRYVFRPGEPRTAVLAAATPMTGTHP